MSKLILFFSFVFLGLLLVLGLAYPGSPVMWMASASGGFTELRVALMVVLVGLLMTNPPRHKVLRYFVGILSVSLVVWAVVATYQDKMQLLDSLSILQFSVSAGLIVMERERDELALLRYEARAAQAAAGNPLN